MNVADRLDLFFRAHTIPVTPQKEYRSKRRASQPKDALIFRCATTGDEKKDLLLGAYICGEPNDSEYVATEIGLFYPRRSSRGIPGFDALCEGQRL